MSGTRVVVEEGESRRSFTTGNAQGFVARFSSWPTRALQLTFIRWKTFGKRENSQGKCFESDVHRSTLPRLSNSFVKKINNISARVKVSRGYCKRSWETVLKNKTITGNVHGYFKSYYRVNCRGGLPSGFNKRFRSTTRARTTNVVQLGRESFYGIQEDEDDAKSSRFDELQLLITCTHVHVHTQTRKERERARKRKSTHVERERERECVCIQELGKT